jgi:hypothetical protein
VGALLNAGGGRITHRARFYKPSDNRALLKIGDAGVDLVLETSPFGFEIRVTRGKVVTMPDVPLQPGLSADKQYSLRYKTPQKANRAFDGLCDAFIQEGFRRSAEITRVTAESYFKAS